MTNHSDGDDDGISRTVCVLCRQRKTRCDRKLPRCGFCVKAKVDCQYVGHPKKRGLRAGYVTELESRIGTYKVLEPRSDTIELCLSSTYVSIQVDLGYSST